MDIKNEQREWIDRIDRQNEWIDWIDIIDRQKSTGDRFIKKIYGQM